MPVLPAAPDAIDGARTDAPQLRTPILITEQQVAFSTAAAASFPASGTSRGLGEATGVIVAALRTMLVSRASTPRAARRHYPARYSFLENAAMGREMYRL